MSVIPASLPPQGPGPMGYPFAIQSLCLSLRGERSNTAQRPPFQINTLGRKGGSRGPHPGSFSQLSPGLSRTDARRCGGVHQHARRRQDVPREVVYPGCIQGGGIPRGVYREVYPPYYSLFLLFHRGCAAPSLSSGVFLRTVIRCRKAPHHARVRAYR